MFRYLTLFWISTIKSVDILKYNLYYGKNVVIAMLLSLIAFLTSENTVLLLWIWIYYGLL